MSISSPLDIAWDHAYWTEGPEFQAFYGSSMATRFAGVSSRGTPSFLVDTWPDEVSTLDATQSTLLNKPTFYSSNAAMNNKPYVDFAAGSNAPGLRTASFTTSAQPNELVIIGRQASSTNATGSFVRDTGQSEILGPDSSTKWRIYAGFNITTGAILDTNAHVFDGQFNGGSSALVIDGSTAVSGNASTGSISQLSIGPDGIGTNHGLQAVFVGVKLGALLSAGDRSDLIAYSQAHWSTP